MATKPWAIVTGASGGIGAAFTKALANRGYSVLAVARGAEPLARIAGELNKDGRIVETLAADLATSEGVKAVLERAQALGDVEFPSTTLACPPPVASWTNLPTRKFNPSE